MLLKIISQFSGVGWITDKKVMKTMKEFANDCLPDNFLKGMWYTSQGKDFFLLQYSLGTNHPIGTWKVVDGIGKDKYFLEI